MRQYHVTYFYLATGMEGRADKEDYGVVTADSVSDAKFIAAKQRHPNMNPTDLDWVIGCLTAKEVR